MEWRRKIDSRSRIYLPLPLREKLGDQVIIQRANKYLLIFSLQDWQNRAEKILAKLPPSLKRRGKRALYGNSLDLKVDSQGRIVLADFLKEGIISGKGVILVERGNYARIYDQEYHRTLSVPC